MTEYHDAIERYQGFRDAVYHLTWEIWSHKLNSLSVDLKLDGIDDGALQQAETVWAPLEDKNRPDIFAWRDIVRQVRSTPRRFDMAIWNGSVLCGMVCGKASKGAQGCDTNVTLRFLQGAPTAINPLRGHIAAISLDAASAYALLLKKRMIFLKNPLSGARPHYEKLGFELAKRHAKGLYLGKAL
ncbi:hypothetical protein AAFO90_00830 [Phaeobacter sp. CAU 1743]|uniref:hypothetical protein n=1 Tax=Phaeobacter sp. CAU 1743 TaxID=3140367 RepID=UPI0023B68B77